MREKIKVKVFRMSNSSSEIENPIRWDDRMMGEAIEVTTATDLDEETSKEATEDVVKDI